MSTKGRTLESVLEKKRARGSEDDLWEEGFDLPLGIGPALAKPPGRVKRHFVVRRGDKTGQNGLTITKMTMPIINNVGTSLAIR